MIRLLRSKQQVVLRHKKQGFSAVCARSSYTHITSRSNSRFSCSSRVCCAVGSLKRARWSAVRALARELGVNLSKVTPSGPRGRITKDDLHNFVKAKLKEAEGGTGVTGGSGIPAIPVVDFEAFGPVERIPMTKIHKLTADNMTRCWLNVPSVTQFDEADITELEVFRKSMKAEAERREVKLTPLPFLIKASAHALAELPQVNASIDPATDRGRQKDVRTHRYRCRHTRWPYGARDS